MKISKTWQASLPVGDPKHVWERFMGKLADGEIGGMFIKAEKTNEFRGGSQFTTEASSGTVGQARLNLWDPDQMTCHLWFMEKNGSPWRIHEYQIVDDDGNHQIKLRVILCDSFHLSPLTALTARNISRQGLKTIYLTI